MVGTLEDRGPSYISSHSADVILSDIRPIKLKIDALNCINVLLDEFLYNILTAARSLSTDKLRAGLLGVLPTSLGKEALLEAEVELRAYWDRTKHGKGGNPAVEDDSATFNLQWAFELLRLKCEAYSTLNESDENQAAEARLVERMGSAGPPPKASLVSPAALYLTAILEHILSNVGRVASRDSSRNTATVNDVFIALCEDESIYSLFKTMNVYEQIEQLSQAPKPRRSKSFSRGDKLSRTTSIQQDQSSRKDSPTPPPVTARVSSDTGPNANRSSFEKARSMKKLISGSRTSNDGSMNGHGHKKSDSILSEDTKGTWAAVAQIDQDDSSLQDFDDLMRSDSTMKVSLTPDRLKTMEVYKQEKQQRSSRGKPAPLHLNSDDSLTSRTNGRRPSVAQVDSITEADEESVAKTFTSPTSHYRQRQHSVATPPPPKAPSSNRLRSASTSTPRLNRKPSQGNTASSSPLMSPPMPPVPPMQTREFRKEFNADQFPPKTRKRQVNRESLDLDDVMAGSDAEDDDETAQATVPTTPKRSAKTKYGGVSASTRELMDFLNEGPPGEPNTPSRANKDLVDFLASGPPDANFAKSPSLDNAKKGSGRLQRMMSKIVMGTSEKSRASQAQQEDLSRSRNGPPSSYNSLNKLPPVAMNAPTGSLASLANRPVPPRPSQILSPPSSPSEDFVPPPKRAANGHATLSTPRSSTPRSVHADPTKPTEEQASNSLSPKSVAATESSPAKADVIPAPPRKSSPSTTAVSRKPAPTSATVTGSSSSAVGISVPDAQEMRRLVSKATSAEECRLLMDIFFARAGVPSETADYDVPYPSPSPSDVAEVRSSVDTTLEISLVELFLGGETINEQPAPRKKKYSSKKVPPVHNGVATTAGNGVVTHDISVKA
ncbi:hypothetical protein K435DRAFT_814695 [Dendrothele bispora CBS 962.96]|uniref:Uncharacterized protein n=1 Tax=Dendrothele bispora (strain CBS 962.96) TaxID=1314807 RepID=A0A4S8N030_DENBC|nr:hypothetical protein K435DRAFT_814695 [Dendrothele bispora CBS 962.96]